MDDFAKELSCRNELASVQSKLNKGEIDEDKAKDRIGRLVMEFGAELVAKASESLVEKENQDAFSKVMSEVREALEALNGGGE